DADARAGLDLQLARLVAEFCHGVFGLQTGHLKTVVMDRKTAISAVTEIFVGPDLSFADRDRHLHSLSPWHRTIFQAKRFAGKWNPSVVWICFEIETRSRHVRSSGDRRCRWMDRSAWNSAPFTHFPRRGIRRRSFGFVGVAHLRNLSP